MIKLNSGTRNCKTRDLKEEEVRGLSESTVRRMGAFDPMKLALRTRCDGGSDGSILKRYISKSKERGRTLDDKEGVRGRNNDVVRRGSVLEVAQLDERIRELIKHLVVVDKIRRRRTVRDTNEKLRKRTRSGWGRNLSKDIEREKSPRSRDLMRTLVRRAGIELVGGLDSGLGGLGQEDKDLLVGADEGLELLELALGALQVLWPLLRSSFICKVEAIVALG